MQETSTIAPVITPGDQRRAPLHDDIAQCARELWIECGCPNDRDLEIWLKAEQRLFSTTTQVSRENETSNHAAAKRTRTKQARV